uniref:Protein kinase domain-containing protein n=1 Tax=Branchiostoma floridae TaxID=7739 RepID=C3Y3H1_BRAFL|eukprot:XP_002609228.1 hypothetical protein BRAFLDRAFT_90682 [Branchiostoma floridae]
MPVRLISRLLNSRTAVNSMDRNDCESDAVHGECVRHGYLLRDTTLGTGSFGLVRLARAQEAAKTRNRRLEEDTRKKGNDRQKFVPVLILKSSRLVTRVALIHADSAQGRCEIRVGSGHEDCGMVYWRLSYTRSATDGVRVEWSRALSSAAASGDGLTHGRRCRAIRLLADGLRSSRATR